jgi:hypothetical protein
LVDRQAKRDEATTHRIDPGRENRVCDGALVRAAGGRKNVARASPKTSLASAVGLGLLAWLAIGNFALRNGGAMALLLGVAAAAGCVGSIRRATRRPVRFSASVDGFTLGSGDRFVPWNEVRAIRVGYHQSMYTEEHSLILELDHDPSDANPFITTNKTNPDKIDVSLDGLSPAWQEIVVNVAAVSGRPVNQMRESAFRLSNRSIDTD